MFELKLTGTYHVIEHEENVQCDFLIDIIKGEFKYFHRCGAIDETTPSQLFDCTE